MKSISIYVGLVLVILLSSCHSKPTLQEYFVKNSENKDFIALDISSNIINVDKAKLTAEQTNALQTFQKINVLAFKLNEKNQGNFVVERAKVNTILQDQKYQQLMKFGSGKEGASVSFVGDDEHIDEFVLFANKKENGFAVVRVLGKDMNPTSIMTLLSVIKNNNAIDLDQLKPLQELFKK